MHVRRCVATGVAAYLACATGATASALGQVVLEGHVLDDASAQRLAGARVSLLNRSDKLVGYAVTDDTGHFRFTKAANGWYRLDVRAVGYKQATTPFLWWMEDHAYAALEVRLAPHAVLLAPLEIVALSPPQTSPVLENVEHRRTRGFGVQVTRAQIEQRRPAHVSDILVELPGVYAARRGSGASARTIYMARALPGLGGGACPVQVFLDGRLASRDRPGGDVLVDDLVSPLDIETIEVFRGLGSIPAEFLTPEARCGVVAIWTKRFSGRRQ
jgi:hypothetical protein